MFRHIKKHLCFAKFSTQNSPKIYPYKFGGLPPTKFPQKSQRQQYKVTQLMLGGEITKNFITAYRAYLQGLRDKDKQFLASIASKELISNIEFEDVDIVGEDSKVEDGIGMEFFVVGVGFDRATHQYQWREFGKQDGMEFKVFAAGSSKLSLPLLYSVQVYFKSKLKLKKSSPESAPEQPEQREQIHMIQFQFQRKQFSIFSIYSIVIKQFWKSLFNRRQDLDIAVLKKILKVEQCQWKIADVDCILGGNFPMLRNDIQQSNNGGRKD